MKFALSELRKKATEPYYFNEVVDLTELEQLNNDIRKIDPVTVKGYCIYKSGEFIFSLNIKGNLILPCARTLVDVPYPIDIQTTEIFSTAEQLSKEDEENEIHLITEEVIDLIPVIKENIILDLPYRIFANEQTIQNKKMLQGNGWKVVTEEDSVKEKNNSIDPRLKKLGVLLNNKNDKTK